MENNKNIQKIILLFILLFNITIGYSETFIVGGNELVIPSPEGFTVVTPEMSGVYRFISHIKDPFNDQLAYYIENKEVTTALLGGMPELMRGTELKVSKSDQQSVFNTKKFAEYKSYLKKNIKDAFQAFKTEISQSINETTNSLNKSYDANVQAQLVHAEPLMPHAESDYFISYSAYLTYLYDVDGVKQKNNTAMTNMAVNVSGKIILLYCFAQKEELEFTRNTCDSWAKEILTENPLPPAQSSIGKQFDWRKALIVGLIGGFISIFVRFLKKKKN